MIFQKWKLKSFSSGWVGLLPNLESFVNNESSKLSKSGMSKAVTEYITLLNMSKHPTCIDLNNNAG